MWSSCQRKTMYCSSHDTHTHTRLTALCPGLPGWARTRKAKPIWILLKQETVSGSGISWAICKSAPRSRQITMPAPHHCFYRPDALPSAQPTASCTQGISEGISCDQLITILYTEKRPLNECSRPSSKSSNSSSILDTDTIQWFSLQGVSSTASLS